MPEIPIYIIFIKYLLLFHLLARCLTISIIHMEKNMLICLTGKFQAAAFPPEIFKKTIVYQCIIFGKLA